MAKTVLVVEDEPMIALDLEQSLREMGFDVVVAPSVAEALDIVVGMPLHFAILDFKLGDGDTMGIARRLIDGRIPFAICSGSDVATARDLLDGVAYIPKPYTNELLRNTVLAALQ